MSEELPLESSTVQETTYWYVVTGLAFLFGGLGLLTGSAGLFLTAALGIVFAGYAKFDADPPPIEPLDLKREVDEPVHSSDEVDITVTVTNRGDVFIPDLRLVDGVPVALEVVDSSPRYSGVLHVGASAEFTYTVAAARGEHVWEPVTVVVGNRSGSKERRATLEVASSINCVRSPLGTRSVPVRRLTRQYAGQVRTESGGSGVEFYGTRAYRHGDPLRSLDWNRLARTGELSTTQYHEGLGVSVVLLIDARKAAYRAPASGAKHAVDRSAEAAGRIFSTLLDGGDRAGIAVFGREDVWLAPGAGDVHRARGHHLLAEHSSLSQIPPSRERFGSLLDERRDELLAERVRDLHRRLPSDAQVFCFAPCCDAYMPTVAYHLDAHGHLVTVVSPNPTAADTPGWYVARLSREHRLRVLHRTGIPVVDWRSNESIETALIRAEPEVP